MGESSPVGDGRGRLARGAQPGGAWAGRGGAGSDGGYGRRSRWTHFAAARCARLLTQWTIPIWGSS